MLSSPLSAATINVNTTANDIANDGFCSVREAVESANTNASSGAAAGECAAGSGADTIDIPPGTYLLSPGPDLTVVFDEPLVIRGAGSTATILDGADLVGIVPQAHFTVDSIWITRMLVDENIENSSIYTFFSPGDLTILRSRVSHSPGGGILFFGSGTVTITDSECDHQLNADRGCLNTSSNLVIRRSSFHSNAGYGITIQGNATSRLVENTTVANNDGNGIVLINGAGAIFNHVTVANNAPQSSNSIGGIHLRAMAGESRISNSILQGNGFRDISVDEGSMISDDYNFVGTSDGFTPNTNDSTSPALLCALANYGGYAPSIALQGLSPAIDYVPTTTLAQDQRGVPRPQGMAADAGAWEGSIVVFKDGFEGVPGCVLNP